MLDVNEERHNKKQNVQEIIVRNHHQKNDRLYYLWKKKLNFVYFEINKILPTSFDFKKIFVISKIILLTFSWQKFHRSFVNSFNWQTKQNANAGNVKNNVNKLPLFW